MNLLNNLLQLLVGLFSKDKGASVQISVDLPAPTAPIKENKMTEQPQIDWADGACRVTPNFTVAECLTLHAWNRLGTELDGANFEKLITLCQKMEEIRAILGCGINVHCTYRSSQYNIEQKILLPTGMDVHAMSLAMDWDADEKYTIQEVKDILEPKLEELGIRMERGTDSWIHTDLHQPGASGRYFTA